MNKFILVSLLNFILLSVNAQTISNKVIATSGSSFSNANFSASQTIGEVSINTLNAGGVTMNQGFHQPTVNNTQCIFSLNGGADSIIVCGTSTTINATSGFATYLWSNGLTTSSITANTSGWYKCTVTQGTCTAIDSVYLRISNVVPTTPTAITITALQTNVCGARKYRYAVPVSTAASLTGYLWSFQGPLNSSMTIDSGSLNSRVLTVTYTSNVVASLADSIKCRYTSICGNSVTKAAKLTNTALNVPTAPASITITSVAQNVCGNRLYRYTAPNLPVATTTTAAATGWVWELTGSLSEFANIDSGDVNTQKILVSFNSNDASVAGDSIKLYYTSGCGDSKTKASKLTNTALKVPAAPASITITALQTNVCGARRYRYTAPVLPAATTTTGVATGYVWDFIGALSATVDSGSLTSRVFTATFSSNVASAIGDSVRVYYTSDCGNSLRKASKLTNTLLGAPLAPASITIQIKSDVCYARTYRYIAPVLPAATTTAGVATGYVWTTPFGALGSTGVIDSGNVNSKIITVTYSSNAAAAAGDSIKLRYSSGCGNGAFKAQKLSNILKACPPLPGFSKIAPKSTTTTTGDLGMQIFPNPNNGNFTIKINTGVLATAKALIEIRDIQGRLVHSINTQNINGVINEQVQKNGLTSGVYLVTYRLGDVRKSMKMVVE
jgi:hypothetical protein